MEFTISSEQIMGLCALATALFGVWKIIKEVKKPSDDLKAEVDQHDKLLKDDNERLKDLELSNKMILQCLLVIITHEITGKGIEKMKDAMD